MVANAYTTGASGAGIRAQPWEAGKAGTSAYSWNA
jgi:hypothetical protein